MEKPNILLILTDQQSASMMGCSGNRFLSTPAMDRLASEGVRFDRAYCTNAVCIPSRFSLMTGLMPSVIGMVSNVVKGLPPIAEKVVRGGLGYRVRCAGYDAFYAGKQHLPLMTAEDLGFEVVCEDERDILAEFCAAFLRKRHARPFLLVASFINPHDICYMAIRDSLQDERERDLVRRGTQEIAELDAALRRPEGVGEEEFFARLCPVLPPNFEVQEDEPEALRLMLDWRPFREKARREWSEKRWREHRWAYCRLTERVDGQIGKVLDALRETGLEKNTLVVFTSDHGDMDASHRMEHKSTLYEEACRVPLIIRLPAGENPGRVERKLVSNGLDLLPTLCDYAGAEVPSLPFGRSLRPLLEGRQCDWRDCLPVEAPVGRGVFFERFKYARYDLGASAEQLADLVLDPYETKNWVNDPAHASVLAEMRQAFDRTFGGPRDPSMIVRALPGS